MNLHTPILMQYEKLHEILSKDLDFHLLDIDTGSGKSGDGLEPVSPNSTMLPLCRCAALSYLGT